jgi:membrane protein
VTVAAPILTTAALTIPLILIRLDVPFAGRVIGNITPIVVLFALFSFLYRFLPVAKTQWKAAFLGAAFTTVGLEASNLLIQIYFKFGTQSAYGKLAVVPLIAFWIYLAWVVIILGAEVGYLVQNGQDILDKREFEPTFRETEAVIRILERLKSSFHNGSGPITFEELRADTGLPNKSLGRVLRYLVAQHWVIRSDDGYGLGKDLSKIKWSELLEDYIQHSVSLKTKPKDSTQEQFQQAVRRFLNF